MKSKNLLQALIALNIVVVCLCKVQVRIPVKFSADGTKVLNYVTCYGIFYESERVKCTVEVFDNKEIRIVHLNGSVEHVQTGEVRFSNPETTEGSIKITKELIGSQEPVSTFEAYKVTRQIQVKKVSIEGGSNFRLLTFLGIDVKDNATKRKVDGTRVYFEYRHINSEVVDITLKEQMKVELEAKATKGKSKDEESNREKKAAMKKKIIESTWIRSKFDETISASVQDPGLFDQAILTLTLQPVIELELCDQSSAQALYKDFGKEKK